jgi:hypothetical protein
MTSWTVGKLGGTPGKVTFDMPVSVYKRGFPDFRARLAVTYCTLEFIMPEDGIAEILVTDLKGRKVTTLLRRHLKQGKHTIRTDVSVLRSGIYLLVLKKRDQKLVRRLLVQR